MRYYYDSAGNRTGIAYPNGVSTSYAYDNDPRYRLIGITDSGANMVAFQISYTVDSVGNPLSMTDSTGSSTLAWSYGYDANNRLTSATAPNPVPGQPAGGSYGYDWVGNRLHPPADPNPMIYNAADQLTSWPGMHGYQYDTAGNLVTVTGAGTASYNYTPAGLLNQATYSLSAGGGNHTLTNTWDADSNRVKFTAGAGSNPPEYDFVYDITAGIPAVVSESSGSGIIYYIREPNGSLVARSDSANGMRYYHFDEIGSTRLITDSAGNVTDKYDYDAYGAVLWHERDGNSIDQPYQFVGNLGYYTHYQDPDFGLMQLGVRFYDPQAGRFTQRDPLGRPGGPNHYLYVGGNPLDYLDPQGMKKVKIPPFWQIPGVPGVIPPGLRSRLASAIAALSKEGRFCKGINPIPCHYDDLRCTECAFESLEAAYDVLAILGAAFDNLTPTAALFQCQQEARDECMSGSHLGSQTFLKGIDCLLGSISEGLRDWIIKVVFG